MQFFPEAQLTVSGVSAQPPALILLRSTTTVASEQPNLLI